MKKILFLTNDLSLQKGGQELANIFLLNNLNNKFNFTIVNQQFFEETFNYQKIKFDYNIDFRNGFLRGFLKLIKTLIKLNKKNFDLILISATPFSTLLFIFIISIFRFFRNKKIIHFCHIDPLSSIFKASRIPFILYPLGLFLYRRFDKIVITNPDMGKSFQKYYFVKKEKLILIPYSLRNNFEKLIKEKPEKKLPKGINILTITRLETDQKDPVTLFKAFALVREKIKNGNLIICGVGPKEEFLKNLAKNLGIEKNVYFFGFVKNPLSILKQSDIFVLSSKSEETPVVLIEALGVGKPIIATNCPVGPRWVLDEGKAGVLVPVGDEKKMTEAIVDLIQNPKKAKFLSKQALKRARLFYPELITNKWKFLLNSISQR